MHKFLLKIVTLALVPALLTTDVSRLAFGVSGLTGELSTRNVQRETRNVPFVSQALALHPSAFQPGGHPFTAALTEVHLFEHLTRSRLSIVRGSVLSLASLLSGQPQSTQATGAPVLKMNQREQDASQWLHMVSAEDIRFHYLPRYGAQTVPAPPSGSYALADFESRTSQIMIQVGPQGADLYRDLLLRLPPDLTKILLVSDSEEAQSVRAWLNTAGLQDPTIRVVVAPAEASFELWSRDNYLVLATPDHHLVIAQPVALGFRGARRADPMAAFAVARLGGSAVYQSDAQFIGGDYLVGIRPDGTRDVFVSPGYTDENRALGLTGAALERASQTLFGQIPIELENVHSGSHLDMYVTFAPGGQVAVADPRLAVTVLSSMSPSDQLAYMRTLIDEVNRLDPQGTVGSQIDEQSLGQAIQNAESYAQVLDSVAHQLQELGYRVRRVPWLTRQPDQTSGRFGMDFTYNNGYYAEPNVYLMPAYGLPSDAVAEQIFREMGMTVIPVPAKTLAFLGSSLHCLTNRVAVDGFTQASDALPAATALPDEDPAHPDDKVFRTDLRRDNYFRFSALFRQTSVEHFEVLLNHFLSHPDPRVRRNILEFMLIDFELHREGRGLPLGDRAGLFDWASVKDLMADINYFDVDDHIANLATEVRLLYTTPEELVKQFAANSKANPAIHAAVAKLRDEYRGRISSQKGVAPMPAESRLVHDGVRSGGPTGDDALKLLPLLQSEDPAVRRDALRILVVRHYRRFELESGALREANLSIDDLWKPIRLFSARSLE